MKGILIAAALSAAASLIILHTGDDTVSQHKKTAVKKALLAASLIPKHIKQADESETPAMQLHGHAAQLQEPGFVTADPVNFITMIP